MHTAGAVPNSGWSCWNAGWGSVFLRSPPGIALQYNALSRGLTERPKQHLTRRMGHTARGNDETARGWVIQYGS